MKPDVAILCAARKSVYKQIPGLDVYDMDRDARTFPGGMPVVGHPPCGPFSAFCRHQYKSDDLEGEIELGKWCVEQVRRYGGVIEQPRFSHLWEECWMPRPNREDNYGFSIALPQFWFGTPTAKHTWLYFVGLERKSLPPMPLKLKRDNEDRQLWTLTRHVKEKTPILFAEWLVECARRTHAMTRLDARKDGV